MPISSGKLWAAYVGAAAVLAAGVSVGVFMNRSDHQPLATTTGTQRSSAVRFNTPVPPSQVYPQMQNSGPWPGTPPSCSSVTAVDAHNVSRQFVIAVGEAYAASPQARQCLAATVVAHSEVKNQDYTMVCTPAPPQVRCTGGQSAEIVFRPGT